MTYDPSKRIPSFNNLSEGFRNSFENIPVSATKDTEAHKFLQKYLQIDKRLVVVWMQNIFIEYFDTNPVPLIVILQEISELPNELAYPQGQMIAAYGLMNSNPTVKNLSLKCFDNWNDPRYINILKYHTMPVKWLQDYLDEIINKLIKTKG